jgi:ketosteroid isomerase-like protein
MRPQIDPTIIRSEIVEVEERLRQAELGPDPAVFEELLADEAVMVGQDGQPSHAKAKVVQAHQPGAGPKFTRVENADVEIVEHGDAAAVVTCKGTYEAPNGSFTLRFMRVWLKRNGRWQIIAGSIAG